MKSFIFIYPDPNEPYNLFIDVSKYAWSAVLTQEHTSLIDGKTLKHQQSIIHVSGLFQDNQPKCETLTKKDYAIYMTFKKLSFYLADAVITSKSDHLSLKILLQKMILNQTKWFGC